MTYIQGIHSLLSWHFCPENCPADFRISQLSENLHCLHWVLSLQGYPYYGLLLTFHLVNRLQIRRPYSPRPCHSASGQNWYCTPLPMRSTNFQLCMSPTDMHALSPGEVPKLRGVFVRGQIWVGTPPLWSNRIEATRSSDTVQNNHPHGVAAQSRCLRSLVLISSTFWRSIPNVTT